jgi:hypothetical protein
LAIDIVLRKAESVAMMVGDGELVVRGPGRRKRRATIRGRDGERDPLAPAYNLRSDGKDFLFESPASP